MKPIEWRSLVAEDEPTLMAIAQDGNHSRRVLGTTLLLLKQGWSSSWNKLVNELKQKGLTVHYATLAGWLKMYQDIGLERTAMTFGRTHQRNYGNGVKSFPADIPDAVLQKVRMDLISQYKGIHAERKRASEEAQRELEWQKKRTKHKLLAIAILQKLKHGFPRRLLSYEKILSSNTVRAWERLLEDMVKADSKEVIDETYLSLFLDRIIARCKKRLYGANSVLWSTVDDWLDEKAG